MKLHNSLTKSTDEFQPLNGGQINIYSCGPTVYDQLHIGNLRAFVAADILRRALAPAFHATQIKHIMNITDVDDKTIKRSREQYPDLSPQEALQKLTVKYASIFLTDMERIGNDVKALTITRATEEENIKAMQELISELHNNGFAYIADDGVYFSIEAYKKDGKTYGQLTPVTVASTADARINNDEYDKESAHDFVLWKLAKEREPSWDFELEGKNLAGRPGWHIECSAMSARLLGQPFDIHTGGVDLKFPHHENEIAQSTAGNDKKYANFFIHNEHMQVDSQKMAKSANNFYTLDDIVKKGIDVIALRLLFLQAHYRNQMNFSWESLEAAQANLISLQAWADQIHQPNNEELSDEEVKKLESTVKEALSDDLNSAKALAAINDEAGHWAPTPGLLGWLDDLLGLSLFGRPDISDEQKDLINQREQARKSQDWQRSDELRAKLTEQGLEINDTEDGPIWSRARRIVPLVES